MRYPLANGPYFGAVPNPASPANALDWSPGQPGDVGLSPYRRLFRLLAKLEALRSAPPFQYLVTTTTSPPEEMIKDNAVVPQLQGLEPSERLLRRDPLAQVMEPSRFQKEAA